MTAKVHRKCKYFNMYFNACLRTQNSVRPWDDACDCYVLKDDLQLKGK